MKHLYEAAAILEAASLAETGVDLFVGTLPHDVHEGVELRDPLYGAEIDEEQDGFTKHQFQIIVRGKDPDVAWDRCKALGDALRVIDHQGASVTIRKMYPLTFPATYPKGDSDEMETSINMRVWFKLT